MPLEFRFLDFTACTGYGPGRKSECVRSISMCRPRSCLRNMLLYPDLPKMNRRRRELRTRPSFSTAANQAATHVHGHPENSTHLPRNSRSKDALGRLWKVMRNLANPRCLPNCRRIQPHSVANERKRRLVPCGFESRRPPQSFSANGKREAQPDRPRSSCRLHALVCGIG